jgi:hypothetical protein
MAILRHVLREENKGDGSVNPPKVVAGPGETQDSMPKDPPAKDPDKGDAVGDEAAKEAAKKAEEDAAKAAAAKDAGGDKTDKDGDTDLKISVPKARMDAALVRAREAEARADAAELRATEAERTPATAKADDDDDTLTIAQAEKRIGELDAEIAKAMKDEDDEGGAKAAVLLREQRELSEGVRDAKLEDATVAQTAQTTESIQFDRVVTDLEGRIPILDEKHDDFDKDLTDEVVELARALHRQGGRSQGDAMILAVDYMSTKLGLDGTDTVKEVKKKETDIAGNVDKAKKLPPDLAASKAGSDSDKAGVTADSKRAMDMSPEEFEALSGNPEEMSRLRGDFVT